MQQYEQELEKKSNEVAEMQAQQSQLVQENSDLSHQLYVLKTKFNPASSQATSTDQDKIESIQKDQMV